MKGDPLHVGTRRLRRLLGGAIVAASVLALPAGASAAEFVVEETADSGAGTLRQAVEDAGNNSEADTITFDVTGKIQLESEIVWGGDDLTIVGPGAGSLVISGGPGFNVFTLLGGPSTISDLTVANGHNRLAGLNHAEEFGGGILNLNFGDLTLDRMVVRDNTVETAATGDDHSARAYGGGVANFGELTVLRSTVSGNRALATTAGDDTPAGDDATAHARGGGIYNAEEGVLVVDASTFSNNTADGRALGAAFRAGGGGAIYSRDDARVSRSTIVGNAVHAFPEQEGLSGATGGGLVSTQAPMLVEAVTIARNRAVTGSNLAFGFQVQLTDTIVSEPAGPGHNCALSGFGGSNGYNIEDDNSCGFGHATDRSDTDPLLAANLSENGGPTETLALLPGSPAIDRGIAAGQTSDQRGLPRPSDFAAIANLADGSDVGAFELQASAQATPRTADTGGPSCRGHDATIVGTDATETITGTEEVDVIVAGAGDDRIRGLAGNDVLCGGEGRDRISGDTGFDKLEGQAGNDGLNGGTGRDKLFGQAGADRLHGAGGRDTCRGGGGRDVAFACEVERTV